MLESRRQRGHRIVLPTDATGQTAFSQKQEVYLESGFCLGGYSAFSERIVKPENMGG